MARLHPYLRFNGNCREAMNFYRDILGGDLTIDTMGASPMAGEMPEEMRDKVLHSMLVSGDLVLMGTDAMGNDLTGQGSPVTLALVSDSREEVRGYFEKLAVGGTISQPLQEAFFGLFGSLTDQYGFDWLFQAGSGPSA